MEKLILITNDDGVDSNGIKVLIALAKDFGKVVVVAPDGARSGQSNAITVEHPIFCKKLHEESNIEVFSCSGTPTDCVKLALNKILNRKPDLVLSGINHGSNASTNVLYSGTMGAVFEGCMQDISSIGFSFCSDDKNADFTPCLAYFKFIIEKVLVEPLKKGVCLNVNAPLGQIKGTKVCCQGRGVWTEEFDERRKPDGKRYFWLTGHFVSKNEDDARTDEWAHKNGYISIVPQLIDFTDYETFDSLKQSGYEAF